MTTQDAIQEASIESIGRAIVRHAATALKVPEALGDFDIDAGFFTEEGFAIGGHPLDSMDLMEVITMIEDDLQVPLLDSGTIDDIASIRRLSELIRSVTPAQSVQRYVEQWSIAGAVHG